MLPRSLSDEACSLAPGVERLAVTAEILLARRRRPRSARFYRSRIRSDARLSYEQLDEFFAGRAGPAEPIAEPLDARPPRRGRAARAGAAARRSRSRPREPEFEFDADGDVVAAALGRADRGARR